MPLRTSTLWCNPTSELFLLKLKFRSHVAIIQVHKHTLSYTPTLCEWRVHVDMFMRAHLYMDVHVCGRRNPCQVSPLFVICLIFLRRGLPRYQSLLIQLDRVTMISVLSPSLPSQDWGSDPQATVASFLYGNSGSQTWTASLLLSHLSPAYELILSIAEFKTQLPIWFGRMEFCS